MPQVHARPSLQALPDIKRDDKRRAAVDISASVQAEPVLKKERDYNLEAKRTVRGGLCRQDL